MNLHMISSYCSYFSFCSGVSGMGAMGCCRPPDCAAGNSSVTGNVTSDGDGSGDDELFMSFAC